MRTYGSQREYRILTENVNSKYVQTTASESITEDVNSKRVQTATRESTTEDVHLKCGRSPASQSITDNVNMKRGYTAAGEISPRTWYVTVQELSHSSASVCPEWCNQHQNSFHMSTSSNEGVEDAGRCVGGGMFGRRRGGGGADLEVGGGDSCGGGEGGRGGGVGGGERRGKSLCVISLTVKKKSDTSAFSEGESEDVTVLVQDNMYQTHKNCQKLFRVCVSLSIPLSPPPLPPPSPILPVSFTST